MKKNYVYAFLTVSIWGTLAAVAKLLLSDIPNLQTLTVSSVFAFIFMLIINIKNGSIKKLKMYSVKDYVIMAALGFLGLFLYSALYYYGLTQLSSQEACILNYLWPLMLVICSCIILKEKFTLTKAIAMICSFVGIVVLSTGNKITSDENAVSGIISCIIAAICYGLFSVLNKKADYNQNISMMVIWLAVAVYSAPLGLMTEEWKPIEGVQWLGMIWLGVVINAVAYLLWALALKGAENTAKIANLAYLTPFLSLIVSAVVLKEQITLRAVIALLFIVGGILLQSFCDRAKPKKHSVGKN